MVSRSVYSKKMTFISEHLKEYLVAKTSLSRCILHAHDPSIG